MHPDEKVAGSSSCMKLASGCILVLSWKEKICMRISSFLRSTRYLAAIWSVISCPFMYNWFCFFSTTNPLN